LTDVKPSALGISPEQSGSALQQQDVHDSPPKQTVQPDTDSQLLKAFKSEQIQPPVVKEKVVTERSSSVGVDDELESILSEFSLPEGEELPNDEELMSIFDLCNTPV
jgi:hypothetical protein